MTIFQTTGVRKAWGIVTNPEERWRLSLLINKTRSRIAVRGGRPAGYDVELDALSETARKYPAALQLAVRKHWRAGDLVAGLGLVDEVWARSGAESGAYAFACAKVWYQYGHARKGDQALSVAKRLLPEDLSVWALEAETQAQRGNAHASINAAENALRLTLERHRSEQWRLFLGEQYFRLDQHEMVVETMGPAVHKETPWRRHYEYALSLEQLGNRDEARSHLLECALKAVPKALTGFEIAELHFKGERHRAMMDELHHAPDGEERSRLLARSMLALGQFQTCAEFAASADRTAQLVEYGALASELNGDHQAALAAYKVLRRLPTKPGRRPMILRRLARVAHHLGEFEEAVEAEVLLSNNPDQLRGMDDEVDPRFDLLVEATNKSLLAGDWSAAADQLRSLSLSASSGKNISRVSRLSGLIAADRGRYCEASTAFFKSNPFPLPNSGEANAKPVALTGVERYVETILTTALDSEVVLYESFYGAKTSCNPLAMCLALLERPDQAHLKHVWVLKDGAPIHRSLLGRKNVSFVRYLSTGYMVHLATAGRLINNSTFPKWFVRREGQRYVNTWHGTPWKHMGIDVSDDAFSFENVARNFLQSSDLLLPNAFTAETLIQTQSVDKLIRRAPRIVGSPRVDRTLRQTKEQKKDLIEGLGLDSKRPNVLYAPTWRGTMKNRDASDAWFFDAVNTLAAQNVNLLVRAHYFDGVSADQSFFPDNVFFPDESYDSNELLGIADILVSDYSSILFDYAALGRPIIKYVFDLDDYTSSRGLYFDVEDIPGVATKSLQGLAEELSDCIRGLASSVDRRELPTAHLWSNEDGFATERAIEALLGEAPEPDLRRAPLLLSMNSLNPNGITRSFGNLIESLSGRVAHIQGMLPTRFFSGAETQEAALRLRSGLDYTLRSTFNTGTRQEKIVWGKLTPLRESFPEELRLWLRSRMKAEFRRLFADTKFNAVVDFDGHDLYAAALAAYGPDSATERVYVGHNEFRAEMMMRFPNHRGIGTVLDGFSRIAAVSAAVMQANAEGLAAIFGIAEDTHTVLPNTLNVVEIEQGGREDLEEDLDAWFSRPGAHLIMVGRLSPEKNHIMAFKALKQVRDNGTCVDVLVLGDGPLRADLERDASALGLTNAIRFAGQRQNPYASIKRADGLLLSSRHEGQPMVFLEAMTLGVPIAATRIPASVSTLEEGKHGLLVDLSVEGLEHAIQALSEGHILPAEFDSVTYCEQSVQEFLMLVAPTKSTP